MFRKKVLPISQVLQEVVRSEGLETPLQQKRLVEAWDVIAGPAVANYTEEKFIKNQTLFVKITSSALRSELMMRRTELQQQLNKYVGAFVIADIRIY